MPAAPAGGTLAAAMSHAPPAPDATDAPGLSEDEAARRLAAHGPNRLRAAPRPSLARRFLARLADPLLLVLLAASLIAAATGDTLSFGIVAAVVLVSATLDLVQTQKADDTLAALQQTVALRAAVWRDGLLTDRPVHTLVPGDVVQLAAGALVPADGTLRQTTDFFVNQATLTGEAEPVELHAGGTALMGSSVVSGAARLEVSATGAQTELGRLAGRLAEPAPPSAFERGTRRFGLMLTRWTMAMVLGVLLLNVLYQRPLLESFLFAVALAVGLTPELLPMIVSVTLARGAMRLARREVVVKRLSAVQDLGAMDLLCTDKTGTLTEAAPAVERVLDARGRDSDAVFVLAWLNARFETGVKSPLDAAILAHATPPGGAGWRKLDEVPFDFERRRISVLVERDGRRLLVVKGAPEDVLLRAAAWDDDGTERPLDDAARTRIAALFDACSAEGLRLLAVARRLVDDGTVDVGADDEHDLVFAGFVAFADPPKASTGAALQALRAHGVETVVVTGDHEAVARHLCAAVRLPVRGVLDGPHIARLDEPALRAAVAGCNLFCRVTPAQKHRLVRAFVQRGHVVGYLGDGANDAPPLHAADVGISVDGAVDVAKQAADLVLLRHDLGVLCDGLREGRRTMVNVEKYLRMATSSNFGNMVSMAVAALFLPFLPMRPLQILLNNLLYDLSELALPADRVADDELQRPRRWDIAGVRRFMLWFGPLSSLFDLAAFALLLKLFSAGEALFQTAWFVQSIATQVLVVFVIRTRGAAWRDRPARAVVAASLGVAALALLLPWTPAAPLFGLVPLPPALLALVAALTAVYLAAAEALKRRFYRGAGAPA